MTKDYPHSDIVRQPQLDRIFGLNLWVPRKQDAPASKSILAANLTALMDAHPVLRTQLQIRKRAGELGFPLAQSTISRAKNAKVALDLDSLDALARVFDIPTWRLISDNLGFPREPITVRNETLPHPISDDIVKRHIKAAPRLRKRYRSTVQTDD